MMVLRNFKQIKNLEKVRRRSLHLDQLDLIKYGYPVDFQKCQNHRKANLINKSIVDRIEQRIVCECCGRIVGSQPQKSFCYDNNIHAKYGPGIPLYFLFFKYVIILLVIYFCVFGIYGTLSNYLSHDCEKPRYCWNDNFGMRISFLNSYKEQNVAYIQLLLVTFLVILNIFIFLFIRYNLKSRKQEFDSFLISPSDFSIILRRLPKLTTETDIKQTIESVRFFLSDQQKIATNNLKIHKILFAYNLDKYLEVDEKNIQRFKQSCKQKSVFKPIPPPQINQRLSTAVVIFQKQASKILFTGHLSCLQQFKQSHWLGYQPLSSLVEVNGQYVNVQRAPQPDDIIWVNQGVGAKEISVRRLLVLSFSVGMLIVSAGFQYALAKWRRKFSLEDQNAQRLFSLGLACFITVINALITLSLVISTKFQKPRTYTLQKISLIFKLALMQFINSGLISVIITSAMSLPSFKFYKMVIYNDMLYIMTMNVIVNNIMNFLMVSLEIPSWLDRLLLYVRVESYTQKEANRIFEANEVDLEYKYAYIFKTLWLTAFFMPTQPCVVFISILALLINYWSQKYLFSGFYSIPYMFSGRISISVLDMLNHTCLWLVMGSFFIHFLRVNFHFRLIPTQYVVLHAVGLVLSLFMIYAPLTTLSKNIFGYSLTKNQYHRSYQIEEEYFQMTYQSTNPAYRKGRKFKGKFDFIPQRLTEPFQ